MGKGRYIKAAERACARKSRFETAESAEAFAEYRFRAYCCPVCHKFHLTSQGKPATSEAPKSDPPPPGPKLADLDWSPALNPQPKPRREPVRMERPEPPDPLPIAVCVASVRDDGRVILSFGGRLVKSAKVDLAIRPLLYAGVEVAIRPDSSPPIIVGVPGDATPSR